MLCFVAVSSLMATIGLRECQDPGSEDCLFPGTLKGFKMCANHLAKTGDRRSIDEPYKWPWGQRLYLSGIFLPAMPRPFHRRTGRRERSWLPARVNKKTTRHRNQTIAEAGAKHLEAHIERNQ